MKIDKKEVIAESNYLNIKISTYPLAFSIIDKVLFDFASFKYGIVVNDGKQEFITELARDLDEAKISHQENYDRAILRSEQWFDVPRKKFRYVKYDASAEQAASV